MTGLLLLVTVTVLYAGYNILIKVSASHVPAAATSTITATICLQIAALMTSLVYMSVIMIRGGQVLQLSWGSYLWAAAAGLCIGGAEIAYFYLFACQCAACPGSLGSARRRATAPFSEESPSDTGMGRAYRS